MLGCGIWWVMGERDGNGLELEGAELLVDDLPDDFVGRHGDGLDFFSSSSQKNETPSCRTDCRAQMCWRERLRGRGSVSREEERVGWWRRWDGERASERLSEQLELFRSTQLPV